MLLVEDSHRLSPNVRVIYDNDPAQSVKWVYQDSLMLHQSQQLLQLLQNYQNKLCCLNSILGSASILLLDRHTDRHTQYIHVFRESI